MRICIVSAWEGDHATHLARALEARHDVVLVRSDGPSGLWGDLAYANLQHRHSAAVLQAIEAACGSEPPDYVEFADRGAPGLVSLQARRAGHPLLRDARIGVRLVGSEELTRLHDGTLEIAGGRLVADLEREQLRLADNVIWPGGDGLDLYRRYHDFELPAGAKIAVPLPSPGPAADGDEPVAGEGPLRILFHAPLQRSRGALDLADACLRLRRDDWELTFLGRDTPTAPTGQSVRMTIEEMFGDDPRVGIVDPGPAGERAGHFRRHDLLAAPSRFDIWPAETIEAMAAGLPVLATPVGGLVEIVEHDVTGRVVEDIGFEALGPALERAIEGREELDSMRLSGAPAERARALTDPGTVLEGYERLLAEPVPDGPHRRIEVGARSEPLVSGVVPYNRAAGYIEEAVDSLLGQSHSKIEVIVVNDGSFEPEDSVLERVAERPGVQLVTQVNNGEAAARNLAACLARGEYLMALDADNVLEPQFVERALAVLEADPDLAYATSWLRFIGPDGSQLRPGTGYAPLGNGVVREDTSNLDGDTLALLPRRLFTEEGYRYERDTGTHPDWELYRRLRDDGRHGAVIPELLARYRILPGSLLRTYSEEMMDHGHREMLNRRNFNGVRWTAEVAG